MRLPAPLLLFAVGVYSTTARAQEEAVRAELRRGVDELYSGSAEKARARFERVALTWPGRPEGSLFAGYALWSSIEDDPFRVELRHQYQTQLDRAQSLAEPACSGRRQDAEACLYLGLIYAARVRLHVIDAERLKAASDAKQGKRALDRARALRPEESNALFGLGMYNYYAAQIPKLLRFFGFMLFLPGGDREEGLRQLESARRGADLMGPEATLQLYDIYKLYEKNYAEALACVEDLERAFPGNPRHTLLKATLEAHFMGQPDSAIAACERIEERAGRAEENFTENDGLWARYLAATAQFRKGERSRAIAELKALVDRTSQAPLWSPILTTTLALYCELDGRADEKLFRNAARAVERREVLRYLDTRLRTVLPPEGYKGLQRFSGQFGKFLQS